jgi:hypothetical protein
VGTDVSKERFALSSGSGVALDPRRRPEFSVVPQWEPQTLLCKYLCNHIGKRCVPPCSCWSSCSCSSYVRGVFYKYVPSPVTFVLITLLSGRRQHLQQGNMQLSSVWGAKRLAGGRRFCNNEKQEMAVREWFCTLRFSASSRHFCVWHSAPP